MLNNSAACPSQKMHLNVLCPMVTPEGILLQTTPHGNKILLTQRDWQDKDQRELWVVSLVLFFHFLIHSRQAREGTNTICNRPHRCWRSSLIYKQAIHKVWGFHFASNSGWSEGRSSKKSVAIFSVRCHPFAKPNLFLGNCNEIWVASVCCIQRWKLLVTAKPLSNIPLWIWGFLKILQKQCLSEISDFLQSLTGNCSFTCVLNYAV